MTQDGKTEITEKLGINDSPWTPKRIALRWFEYDHYRDEKLREIGKHFYVLAELMYLTTEPGPERSAGIRKLIEAKDCFIRQAIADQVPIVPADS